MSDRIPVCNPDGEIIERADPSRVRRLKLAPNARLVRKRKGGVVRILLTPIADDSLEVSLRGNPRAASHNHETEDNPEKVWTLKRIPTSSADLYDTVLNELAA